MKRLLICAASALALAACSQAPTQTPAAHAKKEKTPASYAAEGLVAMTLPELAAAIKAGEVTSEEATKAYIARIEAVDWSGPTLQSVLALNPDAIEAARAADAKREAGEPLGLLHGVPILLKDNIESADPVATTAGALALKDNI
ncbi:MAG: hypothetical protein KAH44_16085, partial [Oricola sp.]|nr:hypothetical protein [Oricola sp.]